MYPDTNANEIQTEKNISSFTSGVGEVRGGGGGGGGVGGAGCWQWELDIISIHKIHSPSEIR